jgi:hypothetical protein
LVATGATSWMVKLDGQTGWSNWMPPVSTASRRARARSPSSPPPAGW